MTQPLLQVENLSVGFKTERGDIRAVNDVSFSIFPGQTVALVGESGCGKSVTAMSILRLIPSPPGPLSAVRRGWNRSSLCGRRPRAGPSDRAGNSYNEHPAGESYKLRSDVEVRARGLVRKGGLEPPRPFDHKLLRLARLPVPPLSQAG